MEKMTVVTGASQNHYKSMINMIDSFLAFYKNDESAAIVVYDLGINGNDWLTLKNKYANVNNIHYRVFDYSKYPSYLDIDKNAGEYAWKPVIISDVCEEFGNLIIWMDAGNLIHDRLDEICGMITTDNIYSSTTSGDIAYWTYPATINYIGCNDVTKYNRNGACIALNYNTDWIKDLVREFKTLALIKECIAPEGSSRDNHRQDQAVFTLLYYKYQEKFSFKNYDYYYAYSVHNDVH